jgi:hypothetical protein
MRERMKVLSKLNEQNLIFQHCREFFMTTKLSFEEALKTIKNLPLFSIPRDFITRHIMVCDEITKKKGERKLNLRQNKSDLTLNFLLK